MSVNFQVVDGDYGMDLVDDFVRCYSDRSLNVIGVMEVLGIGRGEYRRLRRYCLGEGLIVSRRHGKERKITYRSNPTYIHNHNGFFRVQKWLDGCLVYFGEYRDYRVAEKVRDRLVECDWDKSQLPRIKREVL